MHIRVPRVIIGPVPSPPVANMDWIVCVFAPLRAGRRNALGPSSELPATQGLIVASSMQARGKNASCEEVR